MSKIDQATLQDLISRDEIDTVLAVFPDMYGRLMGKRITGHFYLDATTEGGMHACNYLLACDMEMDPVPGYSFTSWETGYGDFHAVPDPTTLRVLPWLPKTAFVLCDLQDQGGEAISIAPRQILKRQIERGREAGLVAFGGSELEFYLFRDSYEEAREKHYHDLVTYGWYIEDYHILQGTKEEWIIRNIRNSMDAAGIPVEFSKGEWGPGQHEINLRYAECLEMADRHCLYKHGVKEIAALNDVAITFMAKWDEELAGSSFHLHSSLAPSSGERTNLFHDSKAPRGMSSLFRHWLAGLMAHASEFSIFYAPHINSYKRYQDGSFAPTRIVWSEDNRTAGFRIVGHGGSLRVENRIPGADANPYLAYAATLASGLDGIERKLELGEAFEGDAYGTNGGSRVPMSLDKAIEVFEASEFARKAFGDEVVEHYLHAARTEVRKFHEAVTCWERNRHFERG
jgi:glutamine synthetase